MLDSTKGPLPENSVSYCNCLIVPKSQAKKVRQKLEQEGFFDSRFKLSPVDGEFVGIPLTQDFNAPESIDQSWIGYVQRTLGLHISKEVKAKLNSPHELLLSKISQVLQEYGLSPDLLEELPKKWERHEDLVIIPASTFVSNEWTKIDNLWSVVTSCLNCKRLARHAPVCSDMVRSSQVSLLLGQTGWVTHTDNGIWYSYDVTRCMFSAGNISEKLRVASWNCRGETIVDLFAGIGYFTLPYLVHAKAAHVHACEWNPHALVALRQNLQDNAVSERCTVHPGDCREISIAPIADRVNLGLIPSSELAWPTAVRVLSCKGGMLHIHANVEGNVSKADLEEAGSSEAGEDEVESDEASHRRGKQTSNKALQTACKLWAKDTISKFAVLLTEIKGESSWSVKQSHLEYVKSYGPHIVHVVLDLDCRPVDPS